MRIMNRYLILDYLMIFLTTLGLITFVMTVGALIKAVDLMSRGISPMLITKFFLQNIPYILSFSMPISTLFSALLLFGRLSMDNEISAMKACGLSLWKLVAPLIVLAILFSGICVYINCLVAPMAKYANRKLLQSAGVEQPINLLEEGRYISDFPGLMIYVGRKNGNEVKDVVAYEFNSEGGIKRTVRAKRGKIEPDNEAKALLVKLYDVRMEMPDPIDPMDVSKTTYLNAEYYPIQLDFSKMLKSGRVRLKRSYMTIGQLIDSIRYAGQVLKLTPEQHAMEKKQIREQVRGLEGRVKDGEQDAVDRLAQTEGRRLLLKLTPEDLMIARSRLVIEANRRVSTAVACFTFVLIGVPLGVKSHRKETSLGMVISLAIVFGFYLFIVLAKALADYPALHPNLILWLPLIATQITGILLIRRAS